MEPGRVCDLGAEGRARHELEPRRLGQSSHPLGVVQPAHLLHLDVEDVRGIEASDVHRILHAVAALVGLDEGLHRSPHLGHAAKVEVKLVVDEWGAWNRAGTEVDPAYLFGQMATMRDALVAALTLDIYNRHADNVAMANVAELVNNLRSLFLARGGEFVATPNHHVFERYAAHQGGLSVRTGFRPRR